MINLKNLSLLDLLEKVRILVGGIRATTPGDRFNLEASWDDTGMTITIKPQGK